MSVIVEASTLDIIAPHKSMLPCPYLHNSFANNYLLLILQEGAPTNIHTRQPLGVLRHPNQRIDIPLHI